MSTNLYVGGKQVITYDENIEQEMLYLFFSDEVFSAKVKGETKFVIDWNTLDKSAEYEEFDGFVDYVYAAPAGVLKDRLNVLGFGKTFVKEVFERTHKDLIERHTIRPENMPYVSAKMKSHSEKELKALEFDYATWAQQVERHISLKLSLKEEDQSLDDGPLEILRYADQRVLLRAILEHIDNTAVVALDSVFEDIDWFDEEDGDSARRSWELANSAQIVITEGTYDAQVLKGAIEVLKPHLASYIRFLDFDLKIEGGASSAVKTLKSFAAAGISNRIVAIFDNDSAAYQEVIALKDVKLPPHYKVIHYPDIGLAKEYPTLGPQGDVTMNVNKLAGSIELYLGIDVLKDDRGNLMPVQWKGYMSKIESYQGELLDKALVQKAFNKKLKAAKTDSKNIDKQDWSGLNAILDKLIETLSEIFPLQWRKHYCKRKY